MHFIKKKNNSKKLSKIAVFISRFMTAFCIVSAFMFGCYVAKNYTEQEVMIEINAVGNENRYKDKVIDLEEFGVIKEYDCVEIKIRFSVDDPYETITALNANDYKSIIAYQLDNVSIKSKYPYGFNCLYPLSSTIGWIKHVEYAKYEIKFTAVYSYEESMIITSPSEKIDLTDSSDDGIETTTGSEITNISQDTTQASNEVLVNIEEVLVSKDGKPLIKTRESAGITRSFYYGFSEDMLFNEKITSTEKGYIIKADQEQIRFVIWRDIKKYVNETNEVYFEDLYINENVPFRLSVDNLRDMFDENNVEYSNGYLNVSIYRINSGDVPMSESLPLDMTTEIDRILYHYLDKKNDMYFSIQTTSNGHELNFEDETRKSEYVLLCEIIVE